MGRALHSALVAPILLIAAMQAASADCPPLREVNTIPITVRNSRILVPVTLNGAKATFMLDTGGAISQIAPSMAHELKLPISSDAGKLIDLYGYASTEEASVTLGLGRLQDKTATLHLATRDFDRQEAFDGILAGDYMGAYDTELDLAGGKLNYFSSDHCDGKVIYWPAAAIAAVPMIYRAGHIQVTATVNGKEVRAILDTGAPITTIRAADAKRLFGVTQDSEGNIASRAIDGKTEFLHVFDTLGLEGIAVSKPRILVLPDLVGSHDVNNDYETGSRVHRDDDQDAGDPPLIIGMNVISKLRLFIAFGERKIYVTPPGQLATPDKTNQAH